ncbi:MAG: phosphatidate cytidylyltransferase [Rhizobiaceae bacterium]
MTASGYSNLQLRVMSALVLAAVVLFVTWLGGLPFRILAAAIAGAMFFEWTAMTPGGLKTSPAVHAGAFAVVLAAIVFGVTAVWLLAAILIVGLAAATYAETRGQGVWLAKGFAYAALSGFALALLRADTQSGLVAILFLFAVVWITDIAAYFAGRSLGGPKLAPAISPGKTWSGAVGGTIGGVTGGMIIAHMAGAASYGIFLVALLLSIVAQFGDLFESSVKRRAGVKDSGNLIPGHGGVMDRVDGLVAAAIALYVIGALGGGLDHPASALF